MNFKKFGVIIWGFLLSIALSWADDKEDIFYDHVIVFEGNDKLIDDKEILSEDCLNFPELSSGSLYPIESRKDHYLFFQDKECVFKYIRFKKIGSEYQILTNLLGEVSPFCDLFKTSILARVKKGRKLYLSLKKEAKKFKIQQNFIYEFFSGESFEQINLLKIDEMYFEGKVVFKEEQFLFEQSIREKSPVSLTKADDYVKKLYNNEVKK